MAQSCSALLYMLLGICGYPTSVPRYILLILDTYHPNTSLYIHEHGCENLCLFLKQEGGS